MFNLTQLSAVTARRAGIIAIFIIGICFRLEAKTVVPADYANSPGLITTYMNPFDVPVADPFVLKDGDTYYMYGTTDDAVGQGFDVYKSTDLVTWIRAAKCYTPTRNSWGSRNFWAPEVVKKDGAYFLHYTAYSSAEQKRNICVARAESPEGPFVDYAGPLFPEASVIDSHIYHSSETGESFIYVSPEHDPPSKIIGAQISDDFKRVLTSTTVCLTSEYGWEDLWIEGPIIHEHEGTLYMIYSGGAWWEAEYALGYATAESALGPWKKHAANPVLKQSDLVQGPGHNGLAWSPDGTELFVVYHVHAADWSVRRVVALDRIEFENAASGPDILTIPDAPSSTPRPLPSGAPLLHAAKSDDFSSTTLDTTQWQIVNHFPEDWKLADGRLQIVAHDGDYWRTHDDGRNIFLQHAPSGDFAIETRITMDTVETNEQAFITVWTDVDNYVTLAAVELDGLQFAVTREIKGKPSTGLAKNTIGWPVHLRIEKRGETLKFFASKDGIDWQQAGRDASIKNLNQRFVGVGAWSPGSERATPAEFDWFRIEPLK